MGRLAKRSSVTNDANEAVKSYFDRDEGDTAARWSKKCARPPGLLGMALREAKADCNGFPGCLPEVFDPVDVPKAQAVRQMLPDRRNLDSPSPVAEISQSSSSRPSAGERASRR